MTRQTLTKAAIVVLISLTTFAVFHWGDQLGWLNAEAWINLSPDADLQSALVVGLMILILVFSHELELTNNVDEDGHEVVGDERSRRAGDRSVVAIIAVFVVAKLLFEIIVFFSGT